jgi:hypothetical protein
LQSAVAEVLVGQKQVRVVVLVVVLLFSKRFI